MCVFDNIDVSYYVAMPICDQWYTLIKQQFKGEHNFVFLNHKNDSSPFLMWHVNANSLLCNNLGGEDP